MVQFPAAVAGLLAGVGHVGLVGGGGGFGDDELEDLDDLERDLDDDDIVLEDIEDDMGGKVHDAAELTLYSMEEGIADMDLPGMTNQLVLPVFSLWSLGDNFCFVLNCVRLCCGKIHKKKMFLIEWSYLLPTRQHFVGGPGLLGQYHFL